MTGKLKLFCGPMFANKTSTLLQLSSAGDLIIKPKFDNRYSDTMVVSHNGIGKDALSVTSWPKEEMMAYQRIFIDEIQFFCSPAYNGDVISDIQSMCSNGTDVFVFGLDYNWKAEPFPITDKIKQLANKIIKLPASCSICNGGAYWTWKKNPDNEETVRLGNSDIYEARCTQHHPLLSNESNLAA